VRSRTFTNPIGAGADPWVTYWQGNYYYSHADDAIDSTSIYVHRSRTLQGIVQAPAVKVWQSPPGTPYSTQVWAPELHMLDGTWYIYFTGSSGDWFDHRMYVLEAAGPNPQGAYTFKGKIAAATDHHAIDGSVLHYGGQRYFIWSGWDTPTSSDEQRVYIAKMSNPWTIDGDRVEISRPTYSWEMVGTSRVNEGPTALLKGDTLHVIVSVNNYWMSEYALAQVTLTGNDPMNAASWTKKPTPVFAQGNGVSGVGHASFK
jgi:GH43 family beta-xylosidase